MCVYVCVFSGGAKARLPYLLDSNVGQKLNNAAKNKKTKQNKTNKQKKKLLKMLFGVVHFKEFVCVVLVYVVVSYTGVLENVIVNFKNSSLCCWML